MTQPLPKLTDAEREAALQALLDAIRLAVIRGEGKAIAVESLDLARTVGVPVAIVRKLLAKVEPDDVVCHADYTPDCDRWTLPPDEVEAVLAELGVETVSLSDKECKARGIPLDDGFSGGHVWRVPKWATDRDIIRAGRLANGEPVPGASRTERRC